MISFAETYPELVSEWSDENEFGPEMISFGSNKMIMWKGLCGHTWAATAKNRGNGSGCPYCSGNKVLKGFNDLAHLYPKLAEEWDESNGSLKPDMVTRKANREITWKCLRCGQTWRSRIADRTEGHGCPVCSGEKLVPGINDLSAKYPMIAKEWSERNEKKPDRVWPKSRENVWWKCKDCGHEWKAVIDTRVKGSRCPECARREKEERVPYRNIEEERQFKINLVAYYATLAGEEVLIGSDKQIGIELDTYFPEQRSAIIYSRPLQRECLVRRENAKNWLCLNSGIRLYRILPPEGNEYDNCVCITLTDRSLDVLSTALQAIFDMMKMPADVDIERDIKKIKKFSKVAHNATRK